MYKGEMLSLQKTTVDVRAEFNNTRNCKVALEIGSGNAVREVERSVSSSLCSPK